MLLANISGKCKFYSYSLINEIPQNKYNNKITLFDLQFGKYVIFFY